MEREYLIRNGGWLAGMYLLYRESEAIMTPTQEVP